MAAENSLSATMRITAGFADDTKTNINVSNLPALNDTQIDNARTQILNFNNDPSEYRSLMVSKYGATWENISAARLTTVQKTYIF